MDYLIYLYEWAYVRLNFFQHVVQFNLFRMWTNGGLSREVSKRENN